MEQPKCKKHLTHTSDHGSFHLLLSHDRCYGRQEYTSITYNLLILNLAKMDLILSHIVTDMLHCAVWIQRFASIYRTYNAQHDCVNSLKTLQLSSSTCFVKCIIQTNRYTLPDIKQKNREGTVIKQLFKLVRWPVSANLFSHSQTFVFRTFKLFYDNFRSWSHILS